MNNTPLSKQVEALECHLVSQRYRAEAAEGVLSNLHDAAKALADQTGFPVSGGTKIVEVVEDATRKINVLRVVWAEWRERFDQYPGLVRVTNRPFSPGVLSDVLNAWDQQRATIKELQRQLDAEKQKNKPMVGYGQPLVLVNYADIEMRLFNDMAANLPAPALPPGWTAHVTTNRNSAVYYKDPEGRYHWKCPELSINAPGALVGWNGWDKSDYVVVKPTTEYEKQFIRVNCARSTPMGEPVLFKRVRVPATSKDVYTPRVGSLCVFDLAEGGRESFTVVRWATKAEFDVPTFTLW